MAQKFSFIQLSMYNPGQNYHFHDFQLRILAKTLQNLSATQRSSNLDRTLTRINISMNFLDS